MVAITKNRKKFELLPYKELFNVYSTFYYLKFVTRPNFDEDPM